MKAVGIVSGGLDSLLAVRMIQNMNIDVIAVHFVCGFEPFHLNNQKYDQPFQLPGSIEKIGVTCRLIDIRREFAVMLANPPHGYGSCLNPCIDCKILMLKKAKHEMESQNAAFVFTGEVLGQRPMSQRRQALDLIARKSGLNQHLVRPLCGGLMPSTDPEKAGSICRNQLQTIQGRSRRLQIELAHHMGITDFPTPAGGCLLTDPGYTARAKKMMQQRTSGIFHTEDPVLLSVGRHIVLPDGAVAIIGRNQEENPIIERLASSGFIMEATKEPGPTTLLQGAVSDRDFQAATQLTAIYGKGKNRSLVEIRCVRFDGAPITLTVAPDFPAGCEVIT